MTIGSLFSGIGGLELGLEWAGLGPTIWQVEQDPFCRAVLAKHWPHVDRSITDVRAVTTSTLRRPRRIVGGFPCQDVSGAGEGAGLAGARSGLWFVMRDIIGHCRPEGVIVENVASGKKRWLCQVRTDLHALGYRTRAVQISAADVGAPHLRERVFVLALADASGPRLEERPGERRDDGAERAAIERGGALADSIGVRELQSEGRESDERRWPGDCGSSGDVADAERVLVRVESGGGSGPRGSGAAEPGDAGAMGEPEGEGRGRWGGHSLPEAGRLRVAPNAGGGEAQPGMGRGTARLPPGVDRRPELSTSAGEPKEAEARLMGYGPSGDSGRTQELRDVRESARAQEIQRSAGGSRGAWCLRSHGWEAETWDVRNALSALEEAREPDAARAIAALVGARWPAPRGAEQYPWEPPRTATGRQEHRRARLKAQGNAVVPWCAYVAGLVYREWESEVREGRAAA